LTKAVFATPAALGRTDQRGNKRPLGIGQIALIAQAPGDPLPLDAPASTYGITTDSRDSTSSRMSSKNCGDLGDGEKFTAAYYHDRR
jgi:hypothetical protein